MFTPYKEMLPGKRYASGWWTSRKYGRQEIGHGGNLAGFINYIARFPSERVTVIVLSNNGRGSSGKISNVLSAIVFGAPYEIPKERKAIAVASSILDKYVGQYQIQLPPTNFTFTNENGKLMAQRDAEAKIEMFAESETDFFLKTEDATAMALRSRGISYGAPKTIADKTLLIFPEEPTPLLPKTMTVTRSEG